MRALRRRLHRHRVAFIALSGAIFLSIAAIRSLGVLETLELAAYDWLMRGRPQAAPDARVVLVGATEQDIQRYGWPLPDETLAKVLERLAGDAPRAIGIDLYRDHPVGEGYAQLHAVLRDHTQIVGVMKVSDEAGRGGVAPPLALAQTERVGFADTVVDTGGVVRRGLLFLEVGQTTAYAFALRLALKFLEVQGEYPKPGSLDPAHLRLGTVTLPPLRPDDGGYIHADTGGYQILLDYPGAPASFATYTVDEVLSGAITPGTFHDKVIILGVAAGSVKDHFHTPLSADQRIYGIALHGYMTSQLLRAALNGAPPMRFVNESTELAWLGLWVVAGGLMGFWVRAPMRLVLFGALGLVLVGGITYIAFVLRLWMPGVAPALGWVVAAGLMTAHVSNLEKAQRLQLMQMFSRYVPGDVAKALWRQREAFLAGGRPRSERLTATVLFSDLKGFTAVSERLDPQALMAWLNEYMEAMARQVMQHGGVVDKFIGDAVMAVFGVPFARRNDAEIRQDACNAAECALAMGETLAHLNERWRSQGLPSIGMRIGIFTGPLVAGSLGSCDRLEYTVIGDTVNIAARLEGLNKHTFAQEACRILIGESTYDHLAEGYEMQHVGALALTGKAQSVTVYQLLGRRDSVAPIPQPFSKVFFQSNAEESS